MLSAVRLFECFLFGFTIFSMFFYITILFVIRKRRNEVPFNAPFYKIFVSLGFVDLMGAFTYLEQIMLVRFGWINWGKLFYLPWLGQFFRFFQLHHMPFIACTQFNGMVLLAINRYYTITQRIWPNNATMIGVIIQWLIGAAWVAPMLTALPYGVSNRTFDGVRFLAATADVEVVSILLPLEALWWIVETAVIGVLYGIMFKHVKEENQQAIGSGHEDRQVEIKLAMVGFVLFLVMTLYTVMLVLYAITARDLSKRLLFALLYFHCGMLLSVANPFLLLIFSKKTREAFWAIFPWTGNQNESMVEEINLVPSNVPVQRHGHG